MIFDTGSDWLIVFSRICQGCNFGTFDERQSSTFLFEEGIVDIHYGSADIYGWQSMDTVCITSELCAANVTFLSVGMQNGMDMVQASGLVGLGPGGSQSDRFILKLRDAGLIERAVFSFMIDLSGDRSKMALGGYDLEAMAAPGQRLTFHPIIDGSSHWTLNMTSIYIHYKANHTAFIKYSRGVRALVDTGTSFLLMPTTDRDFLLAKLWFEQGIRCVRSVRRPPICLCSREQYLSSFLDLTFVIEGQSYHMPFETYVQYNGGFCFINIQVDPKIDFAYIFGLNFLANYYTVFDQEQKRVGFAINRYAHPRVAEMQEKWANVALTEEVELEQPPGSRLLYQVGSAIALGTLGCLLVARLRTHRS